MRKRHRLGPRRSGSPKWRVIGVLAVGLGATLASSTVQQSTLTRYADIDACVTGCTVAAAGWPLPYLLDYPGLSPANRADLIGAVTGLDRISYGALALDIVVWTAIAWIAVALLRRLRR